MNHVLVLPSAVAIYAWCVKMKPRPPAKRQGSFAWEVAKPVLIAVNAVPVIARRRGFVRRMDCGSVCPLGLGTHALSSAAPSAEMGLAARPVGMPVLP